MTQHLTIIVTGKVQGVGFRRSASACANKLKVCGTVRNSENGAVIFEVEGTKKALDQFVLWCQNGPAMARVEDIEVVHGIVVGHREFHVAR